MKWTEKKKRYLAVGGGAVICVLLLAAIGLQFSKKPSGEDKMPEESQTETEIVVEPSEAVEIKESRETGMVLQPNTAEDNTDQPVDSRPAQTDQTEQSIQPEVTKPAEPEEAVKTDPTMKPDGTKVETPAATEDYERVNTPSEAEPIPEQPRAGDTENGKIYIPGFGWVENNGGGGSGTTAEDMYENGNKIGVMD